MTPLFGTAMTPPRRSCGEFAADRLLAVGHAAGGLLQPPAAALEVKHVTVVHEAVEERRADHDVPQKFSPVVYRPVGRDDRSGALVAAHQDVGQFLAGEVGNWSTKWSSRLISSYHVYGSAGGPLSRLVAGGANFSTYATALGNGGIVPRQDFHDVVVNYRFPDNTRSGWLAGMTNGMTASVGMKNVFNTPPEFDTAPSVFGYLSSFVDVRMREVWMTVRRTF